MQLGLHVHGRDSTLTEYLTEPLHQFHCFVFNFEKVRLDQRRSFDPTLHSNSVSEVVLRIFFSGFFWILASQALDFIYLGPHAHHPSGAN